MSRPIRAGAALVVASLLLSGCTGSSSAGSSEAPSVSAPSPEPEVPGLLLGRLDVCRLGAPSVARLTGLDAEPTERRLTMLPGYAGLVDQCGYGSAFDSTSYTVSVGLAPATATAVRRVPGHGRRVDLGAAGVASTTRDQDTVTFLKGSTLVQLAASRTGDGSSSVSALVRAAGGLVDDMPSEPPDSDEQTAGRCTALDEQAVTGVLGGLPAASRSFGYVDGSALCSWALGPRRILAVALYSNAQSGPFFADQAKLPTSARVRGVPGTAFTTPTRAYVVSGDGQSVVVSGHLGPRSRAGRAAPATPELTALLRSAAAQLR